MTYEYDVFISYRRSDTVGRWVSTHLVPRLQARLEDIAPSSVRISWDQQMDSGSRWPDELKRRLRRSGLLLAVWSADYFRSAWCMAEWRSFRERESMLGLFSEANPRGLVYPIRYADGAHYHPEAQQTQCKKDFSRHNYPDAAFSTSAKYMEFDDLVQEMAEELIAYLDSLPPWRDDFPVVEPDPLPQQIVTRPVL